MGKHDSFSTLEQKIEWLLKHSTFLKGKVDKKRLVLAMKHDGLISKLTYWPDVSIEDAIREAKFKWYKEHDRGEPGRP